MTMTAESCDFLVPSMHCAGCMRKIERGLMALPGVEAARANLSTRRVSVSWAPGRQSKDTLRAALGGLGFDAAPFDPRLLDSGERAARRELLRAIAIAGFAAGNVMLLSVSVWAGLVSDMDEVTRRLFHWISALIALPAMAWAGRPFFRPALAALRGRQMNMDVPISLAIIVSAVASLVETIRGGEHVYFDAGIMLVFFLLIGRWLDHAMRARAGVAARNLLTLHAVEAIRLADDGRSETVAPEALRSGDRVLVAAGMRLPGDGVIESGASDIDSSPITGESVPEPVAAGAPVHAGTLNLSGPLVIRITATGENSLLAGIVRLMEAAEQGRARHVRLADRLVRIYAPAVHLLAGGTLAFWLLVGAGWHVALMNAVAVLIITCPCALGLAVPVVQVVASGRLLKAGMLVKASDALERLADIDMVVFDKTGTLSAGVPELLDSAAIDGDSQTLAAALARGSHHPLARAVVRALGGREVPGLADIVEVPGSGVEGRLDGRPVRLGRRDWAGGDDDAASHAGPELWLAAPERAPVRFRFADRLREDARATVMALRDAGCEVRLLSGDRPDVAAAAAAALGIRDWSGGCRPDDKIAALTKLADAGHRVLMVGDGINDAPALRAAHVSMSPASASDIARSAADLVFQGERLMPVADALDLARRVRRRVLENFALALGYNLLAVPLAVAGLVTPLIAAVAMSSSSIFVTLNALRLGRGKGARP